MANAAISSSSRSRRGFSLAELIVVIAIVLFATSMAIVSYSQFRQSQSVASSASKIESLMVNARTRAIAAGQPSQIVFDLTNQQVWIDDLDAAGAAIETPKAVAAEPIGENVVMQTVRVAGGPENSTGRVEAVFTAAGENPLLTVTLRREFDDANVDGNYYTVMLYPNSAQPRTLRNERR